MVEVLEYFVPITSKAELDGDFIIEGIAINETITSNGHKFLADELRESAKTLNGVPLLKDHNNSVDSIVGKVSSAMFDESNRNIPFKAIVKDSKVKQLIKDGLLNSVSVGAHVNPKDIEEDSDGNLIPHNIQFKELSVVAVPADGGATFSVALNNAYHSLENNNNIERRDKNMTEEEVQKEESQAEVVEEVEVEAEVVEEKSEITEEKVKSWIVDAIKSLKESDADEEPKESEESKEPEEEEEPEDESDEVEEESKYKIKQSFSSFGIERKSYNYN